LLSVLGLFAGGPAILVGRSTKAMKAIDEQSHHIKFFQVYIISIQTKHVR